MGRGFIHSSVAYWRERSFLTLRREEQRESSWCEFSVWWIHLGAAHVAELPCQPPLTDIPCCGDAEHQGDSVAISKSLRPPSVPKLVASTCLFFFFSVISHSRNLGSNTSTIQLCIYAYSLLHNGNKNSTRKRRYGVGERPYAWHEIKFTVLPLTSVNSIFHLRFLYLYILRVSDILKSQLFFSWRPI